MKKWFYYSLVMFLIGMGFGAIYNYLNLHPIKIQHPFPDLTTKYPLLRNLDRMLMLTAGWDWYKVKNKSTGKVYIIKFGYDEIRHCDDIRIWDIDTRKERRITREEYFNDYEDVDKTGIGQWEHYPANIDEAIKMGEGK